MEKLIAKDWGVVNQQHMQYIQNGGVSSCGSFCSALPYFLGGWHKVNVVVVAGGDVYIFSVVSSCSLALRNPNILLPHNLT